MDHSWPSRSNNRGTLTSKRQRSDATGSSPPGEASVPVQALKRLRVDEGKDQLWERVPPECRWDPATPETLHPQAFHEQRQQHEQSTGQDTFSEEMSMDWKSSSPLPQTTMTESSPALTDYRPVNSLLGELHRQRLHRDNIPGVCANPSTSMTQSWAPQMSTDRRQPASQVLSPLRRRKVVQLRTDSQLG